MKNKIIIYFFTPAMVNNVEVWLKEMAQKGWKLISVKGWKFVFQKSKSQNAEYFMCTIFDASKGFSFEYFTAKEKYHKSKSTLNKNNSLSIFEVDVNKIDSQFHKIRARRNTFYKVHYKKLFSFSLLFTILTLIVYLKYNALFLLLFIPFLLSTIYSFISIIILKR